MPVPRTFEEVLSEILNKDLNTLSQADIEFLKARRSYLNPEQRSLYANLLSLPNVPETPKEEIAEILNPSEILEQSFPREIPQPSIQVPQGIDTTQQS
jgi:hypothetical protein